ncbi:MAG: NYN domain-containing protein [Bacilli bacterium]
MSTFNNNNEKNVAILIDAENISPDYISLIMDEANRQGNIAYKNIYGDWSVNRLNKWKDKSIEYSLTQIQQYSVVSGKNTSDFALVIDAMDILYRDKINCFILVSSDSDFIRLVNRLRQGGALVVGMGESKTPRSLTNACHSFVYLDKISKSKTKTKRSQPKTKKNQTSEMATKEEIIENVKDIISSIADESGWAYWSNTNNLLMKKQPSFDPRNYGFNGKGLAFFMENGFETKKSGLDVFIKFKDE